MDVDTEENLEVQRASSLAGSDEVVQNEQEPANISMEENSESDGSNGDVDYADNEEEEEDDGNAPSNQDGSEVKKTLKTKGRKRKHPPNKRRNIRKVFRPDQLDSRTLEAQQQEQERLKRLELQHSVSEQAPSIIVPSQEITAKDNDQVFEEYIVGDSVVISDDDNDSVLLDVSAQRPESVILISSSESDDESDSFDEDELDSSDEPIDLNVCRDPRNEDGKVQVNLNHPVNEPDIFLPSVIASAVKPHQVEAFS